MSEITNFKGETVQPELDESIDLRVESLIQKVGQRVRKARELKGLPRRVISERSGVSPRYLAQLEAGEGNISIGLLKRVAIALDFRLEWFVSEEDPWSSETLKFTNLYRSTSAVTRAQVMELLDPNTADQHKAQRICLLGLRGAGKSTLGAMAGQSLQVPFCELNREIEDHSGIPVNEVLALYGQEGYRKLETQAVDRIIATHDSVILAVAGGVVSDPEGFKTLLTRFHTIWLKASPAEHMSRVLAQGDTRPMAGNPEAMDQLKTILQNREALYAQADATLETSQKSPQATHDELVDLIRSRGFLDEA